MMTNAPAYKYVAAAACGAFVHLASPAKSHDAMECAVDKRTEAHQCFLPREVREANGIRYAPLLTGGPAEVRRTTYSVHANCTTGVLHLKDASGVSFAGGYINATPNARDLWTKLCAATPPQSQRKK